MISLTFDLSSTVKDLLDENAKVFSMIAENLIVSEKYRFSRHNVGDDLVISALRIGMEKNLESPLPELVPGVSLEHAADIGFISLAYSQVCNRMQCRCHFQAQIRFLIRVDARKTGRTSSFFSAFLPAAAQYETGCPVFSVKGRIFGIQPLRF